MTEHTTAIVALARLKWLLYRLNYRIVMPDGPIPPPAPDEITGAQGDAGVLFRHHWEQATDTERAEVLDGELDEWERVAVEIALDSEVPPLA
jgi:hypothetical protein